MRRWLDRFFGVPEELSKLSKAEQKDVRDLAFKNDGWLRASSYLGLIGGFGLANLTFAIYRRSGGSDFTVMICAVFGWLFVAQWLVNRWMVYPRLRKFLQINSNPQSPAP
jgi:hypothetical protein